MPRARRAPRAAWFGWLAGFALCTQSCDDSTSGNPPAPLDAALPIARTVPLLDQHSWRRYDPSLDPLASHQPPVVMCPESATLVELDSYEIDTTRCNYVLSEHPSLRALAVDTEVRLTLLHYDLFAPTPAEAHVALLFEDAVQWEKTLPIPAPGGVVEGTFRTNRALAAGAPIRLHLHNHGANTYLLVSVEAVVEYLNKNVRNAQIIMREAVRQLANKPRGCKCESALKNAIFTAPDLWPAATTKKLEAIIGKYRDR